MGENVYYKFQTLTILSYLSPHFYNYNVQIWLKRMNLGMPQQHKISSELLNGLYSLSVLHCLGGVHFDFWLLPATRSLERRARYLFYCMFFVCFFLFGQRFLDKPQADSRQSLHAGVLWFRMCLLPFWGLGAPGGQKKGEIKFSLL